MVARSASFFERVLWNFYIVDRNITTFEHPEDVPEFTNQMVPIFLVFIASEELIKRIKKKGTPLRLNDGITSLGLGMIMEMTKLLTKGFELIGYSWLYQHRIFDLDWQSPWTWWLAAIGVDFGYYWVHRAAHEISLFWCGHQVHHSSEDYNLTTALRQSAFQHFFSVGFYQPLALLGIPLPAILVHLQFSLYFQFWIHTEVVSNLGPLEWIFNTASHHRVHHGANKWCLDKNYAGFLIIWDRIFGTFQAERKDEKIVYGLVSQPQTFNPIYLQVFYFKGTFQRAFSMTTWSDFCKALFYGPGWTPGAPRLGDESAIPDEPPQRKRYDPSLPFWIQMYLLFHFAIVIYVQQMLMVQYTSFTWGSALTFMGLVFLSLFTIGCTFDGHWCAPLMEAARCVATVGLLSHGSVVDTSETLNRLLAGYFALSALIWTSQSMTTFSTKKGKVL